jgi:pimeloyl-ACP methyl ester carboxylesterase
MIMSGSMQPTVVLVHGAFADASGFGGVIRELTTSGYEVVAPPNPLRSLAFDANAVGAYARAIDGPVVLVGHSYGGAVITQASADLENVVGLVYLSAFGIDVGESCASVQGPFSPSMLAPSSTSARISSGRRSARMCRSTSPRSCGRRSGRCRSRR